MKKLLVLITTLMVFTACHNTEEERIKVSGGGVNVSEQEQEDFQNMLKERSRYNAIFNAVKMDVADAWDSMLDIFGDYVVEDAFIDNLLSADTKDTFGFGGYGENEGELYY